MRSLGSLLSRRIVVISDSHSGEIVAHAARFFFWRSAMDMPTLLWIHIGTEDKKDIVNREFLTGLGISVSYYWFPIVGVSLGKKICGMCNLLLRIMRWRRALFFVPYDQKPSFYRLLAFLNVTAIAVPHTTGREVYAESVFVNKKKKFAKHIPVLIADSRASSYFQYLGFSKLINAGSYVSNPNYLKLLTSNLPLEKYEGKRLVVIFTAHRSTKQYSEESWLRSHDSIFNALSRWSGEVWIKGHPSQPDDDLDLLIKRAALRALRVKATTLNAVPLCAIASKVVNFVTSAGQHAIDTKTPVVNFALPETRGQLEDFGIDPEPFKLLGIHELTDENHLRHFLNDESGSYIASGCEGPTNLLSLQQITKCLT